MDDTVDDNVLDSRVFTLSVLADDDCVYVVVGGLEALEGAAWADVGKEIEGSAEGEVEGDVTLSDWGSEGALECDKIALD